MISETLDVNLSDGGYGFEGDELTFRYTEKEDDYRRVERYQLMDDLGIVLSGEKIWRTEENTGFLGLFRKEKEVHEEDMKKRVGYDRNTQSVITENASWSEFR